MSKKMSKKEPREIVDHPDHYNQGIEVIDFIESWNFDFATGNIIKYVARHRFKDEPLDDLKKARWYIDRLIETYEEQKFQSIYGLVKAYEEQEK
mgnify:CR=1 FL=1